MKNLSNNLVGSPYRVFNEEYYENEEKFKIFVDGYLVSLHDYMDKLIKNVMKQKVDRPF